MKIIMTIQMIMMIKGRYQSCVLFTDSQNSCLCFLDLFKGSFHELQRKLEVFVNGDDGVASDDHDDDVACHFDCGSTCLIKSVVVLN